MSYSARRARSSLRFPSRERSGPESCAKVGSVGGVFVASCDCGFVKVCSSLKTYTLVGTTVRSRNQGKSPPTHRTGRRKIRHPWQRLGAKWCGGSRLDRLGLRLPSWCRRQHRLRRWFLWRSNGLSDSHHTFFSCSPGNTSREYTRRSVDVPATQGIT